ncbi:hypothetical protein NL108_012101 [Boleophthalmus pectinirostris]|nr:hypothetical protein NL108_012101 [Boleophthalmus pectinirostris]
MLGSRSGSVGYTCPILATLLRSVEANSWTAGFAASEDPGNDGTVMSFSKSCSLLVLTKTHRLHSGTRSQKAQFLPTKGWKKFQTLGKGSESGTMWASGAMDNVSDYRSEDSGFSSWLA